MPDTDCTPPATSTHPAKVPPAGSGLGKEPDRTYVPSPAMNCPVCSHPLRVLTVAGVEVDACDGGCGGVWFDAFELQKLMPPRGPDGQALLEIAINPQVTVDHRRKRACPACDGVKLRRHFYSRHLQIQVDSCPGCGGVWLDAGELNQIRRQKLSPPPGGYLDSLQPELSKLKAHGGEAARQAGKIGHLFRFVLPRQ